MPRLCLLNSSDEVMRNIRDAPPPVLATTRMKRPLTIVTWTLGLASRPMPGLPGGRCIRRLDGALFVSYPATPQWLRMIHVQIEAFTQRGPLNRHWAGDSSSRSPGGFVCGPPQLYRTRTRTNTNPNGTEANAAGGRGALAKLLEKFAKSEEFVGVAHSAEQSRGRRAKQLVTCGTRGSLGRGQSVPFSAQGAYCSAPEP